MLFEVPSFCFFFFFFRVLVKGVAALLGKRGFVRKCCYLCSNLLKFKAYVVYFACLSIGLFAVEDYNLCGGCCWNALEILHFCIWVLSLVVLCSLLYLFFFFFWV